MCRHTTRGQACDYVRVGKIQLNFRHPLPRWRNVIRKMTPPFKLISMIVEQLGWMSGAKDEKVDTITIMAASAAQIRCSRDGICQRCTLHSNVFWIHLFEYKLELEILWMPLVHSKPKTVRVFYFQRQAVTLKSKAPLEIIEILPDHKLFRKVFIHVNPDWECKAWFEKKTAKRQHQLFIS